MSMESGREVKAKLRCAARVKGGWWCQPMRSCGQEWQVWGDNEHYLNVGHGEFRIP